MGFKLANINGKSSLVHGDSYYDISTISEGKISSDPSSILNSLSDLHELSRKIDNFEATGFIENSVLKAPITNSKNCFAVGLNYKAHAEESSMEIPPFPMVFTKHTSCIVGPFDDIGVFYQKERAFDRRLYPGYALEEWVLLDRSVDVLPRAAQH